MENKLYKKFSFGLSLSINLYQYETILNNYQKYIKEVYFSLPLGDEFHTRKGVISEYSQKDSLEKLFSILELMKKYNINLEVVINQYNIPEEKILVAVEFVKRFMQIDSICTLDDYIDIIKEKLPDVHMVSSFNNLIVSANDVSNISKKYNEVVVGKNFLRNRKLLEKVKKNGFLTKLLLNNGCSFNCESCRNGRKNCIKIFENNLKYVDVQNLYAIQSFFPSELHKLKDVVEIDKFKISSRPCTYEYLNNCLDSYINNNERSIEKNVQNYHLWGRLAHFMPYYKEFNYKEIRKIKDQLMDNFIS